MTKPTIRQVRPAKTQISLCSNAVWSVFADCMCLLQTPGYPKRDKWEPLSYWWMYRLIWVFAGYTDLIVGFVGLWLICQLLKFCMFVLSVQVHCSDNANLLHIKYINVPTVGPLSSLGIAYLLSSAFFIVLITLFNPKWVYQIENLTIFTVEWDTLTPYHTSKMWIIPFNYMLNCSRTVQWVANRADPDQKPYSVACDPEPSCSKHR